MTITTLKTVHFSLFHTVADNVALNGETLPEKVRLTERAGNFSSNGQIMELDLYQYFQLIAEKGDLQSQVRNDTICSLLNVIVKSSYLHLMGII